LVLSGKHKFKVTDSFLALEKIKLKDKNEIYITDPIDVH